MLLLVEHRAVARSPESRGYLVKYCRSDMVPAPVPAGGGGLFWLSDEQNTRVECFGNTTVRIVTRAQTAET